MNIGEITVAELFKLPFMEKCNLIAGIDGAEKRKVKRINVIDTPDIANWMIGEELLLTTAYVVRDNPLSIKNLIIELNNKHVSALGIKLGRFINSLPEEVLKTADDLEFPLFSLPMNCSFSEMIKFIMEVLSKSEPNTFDVNASHFTFQDYISSSFLEIMVSGKGIQSALEHLKTLINVEIAYLDYKRQAFISTNEKSHFYEEIISHSHKNLSIIYHVFSVDLARENYGLIILDYAKGSQIPLNWRSPINYAKTAILLHLQKQIAVKQAELRHKDAFLQDLMFQHIYSEDDIKEKQSIFGETFLPPYVVMVVDRDNIGANNESIWLSENNRHPFSLREELWSRIYHYLKIHFCRIHYTNIGGKMAAIISLKPDSKEKLAALEKTLRNFKITLSHESEDTLSIAIGGFVNDIVNIAQSYKQAKSCIDFVKSSGLHDSFFIWEKLGLMRLLISNSSKSNKLEVKHYIDQYLGRILALGHLESEQHLSTLWTLLQKGWNLKSTAVEMGLHYNTIRYRIKTISQLIPFDLENPEIRMEVFIAINLYFINKKYDIF